jgi:hypothetical protein
LEKFDVMPGFMPGIHVLEEFNKPKTQQAKDVMAGTYAKTRFSL